LILLNLCIYLDNPHIYLIIYIYIMIPKIIHNIWIQGYNNLPKDIIENHNNIKKLNPNWQFIIWDEK